MKEFRHVLQLREATEFLERAHPLQYVAPVRKSQVQHALTEMLTSILAPHVRSDALR